MNIHILENREPQGWAVFGGYWPRGAVQDREFRLLDFDGNYVPVQNEITALWPDGSIKWSRHTAPAKMLGKQGDLLPASQDTFSEEENEDAVEAPVQDRNLQHAAKAVSVEMKENAASAVSRQSSQQAAFPDGSNRAKAKIAVTASGLAALDEGGLITREVEAGWEVDSAHLHLFIPKAGPHLAEDCRKDGRLFFRAITPTLQICHAQESDEVQRTERRELPGIIHRRTLEVAGPLETVFRFDGAHAEDGTEKMPFRIRMTIHPDGEIDYDDTFFFQGDPEKDQLGGWGLRFDVPLTGESWQRHIRMMMGNPMYHDNPTQLFYWRKHLDPALLAAQQRGETIPATEELREIAKDLPRWDHFCLTQDSASHYSLRKKAWEDGCWLEGVQGQWASGTMAVSDPEGTICFHLRDFREKHPSGLEAEGLSGAEPRCTAWFYAPQAEPFDFRHYDRRTYPMGNYEGFDYMRADPNGIAVTRHLSVCLEKGYLPDRDVQEQNDTVRRPALYFASPDYYHKHRAFGFWSLPLRNTEMDQWAEDQITAACRFYGAEAEARSWNGLFNYGDFMHTYEPSRHMWRWDVGGYAWDNTELAPTYWLWLQFLRTGQENVFTLAENLSRHAADVDMYHFGELKGLGSRHNVRHWGCPCKEPRISMAGHHRPLYYLTGDRRIGDCMEDSLAAAESLASAAWFRQSDGSVHVRSGPDWAALVSNWMTAWERTGDDRWRRMIETGIADLRATPLGLTSGPDFGFDSNTGHLIYRGEAQPGASMHLQACMGETEIWLEAASLLESKELADMVSRNGRFFFLSPEERTAESGGLLEGRRFESPIYSAEMQAWAAKQSGDREMGTLIWTRLLSLLYSKDHPEGFRPEIYGFREEGIHQMEIPWISTNFTAQWCLKIIVTKDLIPDSMPQSLKDLDALLQTHGTAWRLYGA